MTKTTTRRRRARSVDQDTNGIPNGPMTSHYDAFATDLNTRFPDPEPEKPVEKAADPQVTALLAQIAALQEQSRLTAEASLRASTVDPVKAPVPPAAVSYENMPDPTIDPEGYGKELQTRITRQLQAQQAYETEVRVQTGNKQAVQDDLWSDFQENFEEYAEDEARIGFVTEQVAKRYQARGVDVGRFMVQNKERFFADITKEYDKVFGAPTDDDDTPVVQSQTALSDPPSRTGGVFGGQESGGRPAPTGAAAEDKDAFTKELRSYQSKSGYY